MRHQFDYLVLGSGIAGLSFALQASRHGTVAMLAKRGRSETNTVYAQGGIAAVLAPHDTVEEHIRDTLVAGAGLCREEAVRVAVTEGPARVRELIELGAEFTRDSTPLGYHLTREGGHSQRRVLHAADQTGREIERTLLDTAARAGVQFFEEQHAIDLIMSSKVHSTAPDGVLGAYAGYPSGEVARASRKWWYWRRAPKVYLYTSNPDARPATASPWRIGRGRRSISSSSSSTRPCSTTAGKSFLISRRCAARAASCATRRARPSWSATIRGASWRRATWWRSASTPS
jgi:L-aspartate oxidase